MIRLPMYHEAKQRIRGLAIVGMAGRFPGAQSVADFWRNLVEGKSGITDVPASRLKNHPLALESNYVAKCAVIPEADHFDAGFFGIYPKQAAEMDPQHRLFLETSWLAMEDAGYVPDETEGRVGVFAGCHMNTYIFCRLAEDAELRNALANSFPGGSLSAEISNDKDYLATRVAYQLNLKGPSVAVQTACSTSLVAIAQACESLVEGACDMAIAGGVTATFPQQQGYLYTPDSILSPDGICRAFDSNARGTIFGDGVGAVVLKRVEDAIADHDDIYAVIKGWGVNNDGGLKNGYTAPSIEGQAAAIEEAHRRAGISAESIDYVEAHGTGTQVGDPIEIAALTKAFRTSTDKTQFCRLASLKTNVGHLDVAAGVAGVIKTGLSLRHRLMPKLLNYESPNPRIDFETSPFVVNDRLTQWDSSETPRRAGVSSFGVGGTNAHLVLEEAPNLDSSLSLRSVHCLPVSAKTDQAVDALATQLSSEIDGKHSSQNLADVAWTLQSGRKEHKFRRVIVVSDTDPKVESSLPTKTLKPGFDVVFGFPGQGSQHVGMARQMYQSESSFANELDRVCEYLIPHVGLDIRSLIFSQHEGASKQLNQTCYAQPALFAVSYSLAKWWQSMGVTPASLIGHSVGEFTAAAISGVMTAQDAAKLVAIRGRLMQDLPSGAMLAIRLGEEELGKVLPTELDLAALNAPEMSVVAGSSSEIECFAKRCELGEFGEDVTCSHLKTSHAFHSRMMDPAVKLFRSTIATVSLRVPEIPIISTVTGAEMSSQLVTDGDYWASQIREPVRFSRAVEKVLDSKQLMFVECGPSQALTSLVRQHKLERTQRVIATLPHARRPAKDLTHALNALGQAWCAGANVEWKKRYSGEQRRRVHLPGYPFERKRYSCLAATKETVAEPLNVVTPDQSKSVLNPGDSAVASRSSSVARGELQNPPVPPTSPQTRSLPSVEEQIVQQQTRLMQKQIQSLLSELQLEQKFLPQGDS